MKITYLGHAGFCVETDHAIIVMDPWLSPMGAFDSSWFQLPQNHHLNETVDAILGRPGKEKYVYVSHEHEDHYDRAFLDSLKNRDFTVLIPRYRRPELRREFSTYECKGVLAVEDAQPVTFPGGEIKLFLDDSELNRDSAILVRAEGETFLNLNDCRIFDRLSEIGEAEGDITVFTCQFSGASWHPTCYEYSREEFDRISNTKVLAKFKMTERAIETLRPRTFLPSAGPVCFLDPELIELNFSASGIFRRAPELIAYIGPTLEAAGTTSVDIQPGDTLDVATGKLELASGERYDDARFADYLAQYAAQYADFFREREEAGRRVGAETVLTRLKDELEQKLTLLSLRDRVTVPLYFALFEIPDVWLRVDFAAGVVERVPAVADEAFYRIRAHAWQIEKVLDRTLSWENFGLSFRVKLQRIPDRYQALVHAFLTLEKGDLVRFCRMLTDLENRKERIEVTVDDKVYSVNRWCPHNGGDLKAGSIEDGRYLVCPRHRWLFDLQNGGACTTNDTTICAEAHGELEPA